MFLNQTHTLYFVQVVVFLLGEQVRVSVFSGVDLSNKKRLEPAVFTETRAAPVTKQEHKSWKQPTLHLLHNEEKKKKRDGTTKERQSNQCNLQLRCLNFLNCKSVKHFKFWFLRTRLACSVTTVQSWSLCHSVILFVYK